MRHGRFDKTLLRERHLQRLSELVHANLYRLQHQGPELFKRRAGEDYLFWRYPRLLRRLRRGRVRRVQRQHHSDLPQRWRNSQDLRQWFIRPASLHGC